MWWHLIILWSGTVNIIQFVRLHELMSQEIDISDTQAYMCMYIDYNTSDIFKHAIIVLNFCIFKCVWWRIDCWREQQLAGQLALFYAFTCTLLIYYIWIVQFPVIFLVDSIQKCILDLNAVFQIVHTMNERYFRKYIMHEYTCKEMYIKYMMSRHTVS